MKRTKVAVVALLVMLMTCVGAEAKLRFGIKGGLNVDRLETNRNLFDGTNRAGYTVGVMGEYMLPILGIGVDLSAMYTRMESQIDPEIAGVDNYNVGKNFIEIPLNIKYKFNIPAVNAIVRPMVYTGPTLALKLDSNGDGNSFATHTCQWGWNLGLGVELIKHLQVSAGYTWGMNNIMKSMPKVIENAPDYTPGNLKIKNNYWTVTAAWLF